MKKLSYPAVGDELYTTVLENGLTVCVVPRRGFRRRQATFAVNYGGAARSFTLAGKRIDTPAGCAHFLEHKMFDMPDGSAMDIFTQRGAEANAYTSADLTAYYFECDQDFHANLELLLKFVTTPYFTDESVERERGIIGQEIRMTEDDPSFVLYTSTMGALFDHHPVRDSVAGTVDTIAEITPEVLYDCHRAFYVPGNMVLTVCGDVDPDEIARMASEFTPSDAREAPRPDYGEVESLEPVSTRVERTMDISEPLFTVAAKISTDLPQSGEAVELLTAGELAVRCLFGPGSDFYTSLYAEGLLRGNFYRDVSPIAGTMIFECGGSSANPELVYERMCSAMEEAAKSGFGAEEFERARRAAYGATLRSLDDADGLCSELAHARFDGCGVYESFAALEKATPDAAVRFVREYLRPERMVLTTVRPK